MGALEIRRSSAQLNSVGQFRMPELDNGSADAFQEQARAAQTAAAAARTAGMSAVDGISRRGQIVARTLGSLGEMAMDYARRENQRIVTDAVIAKRQERNSFMYGDGTPENPGQFNVQMSDAKSWLSNLKTENERMDERFTKEMNAMQRQLYRETMARDEGEWQLRIGSHAAKKTLEAETATAVAATVSARDNAIIKFTEEPFRDQAIASFYEAKEREMDVRGLSEGESRLELRAATEDLLVGLAKNRFTAWENETAQNADPASVETAWDERGKMLESLNGKVPTNPLIRQALGSDAADKAHQELIRMRFDEAKTRAVAKSHRLQSENWSMARDESVKQEYELLKAKPPETAEGQKAYYQDLAQNYAKISENPMLSPQDRLHYIRTSTSLANEVHDAEKAIRTAEMENNYLVAKSDFEGGFTLGPDGRARDLNGATKLAYADRLLQDGKINRTQWRDLHGIADREWDDESTAIRQHVLDLAGKIVPTAVKYRAAQNDYALAESKSVRYGNPTELKMKTWGGHEKMTYGELIKAMNLTLSWRKARGASVDDANAYFDKLCDGTVRAQMQKTVADNLDYDKKTVEAYRSR